MTDPDPSLTPLGLLLEKERLRRKLSKRQAAKLAGISEGRWRQVVSGVQRAGDVEVNVNPRRNTVIAMARAIGVSVNAALGAAGMEPLRDDEVPTDVEDEAILNVLRSSLTEEQKRTVIKILVAEREAAARQRAARSEELIRLFAESDG